MKIKRAMRETADTLSIDGSVLTINGVKYNLENIEPEESVLEKSDLSDEEKYETFPDQENKRVMNRNGEISILLFYDKPRRFMFVNGNLLRFYDVDDSGDISIDELSRIVEYWNKTEKERTEYHKTKI